MKNSIWVLIFVLLLIIVIVYNYYPTENFTTNTPSNIFIEDGKYRTLVNIYKGNIDEVMILIHGVPLDQTIWNPIIRNLQSRKESGKKIPTLVTYDLRGCGTSSNYTINIENLDQQVNNVEWTLNDLAHDVELIRKKFFGTNPKISITGYDFGGCVAQTYALLYPERIQRLLLLQTSGVAIDETERIKKVVNTLSINKEQRQRTLSQEVCQGILCQWFYVTDKKLCPTFYSDPKIHIDQTDSSGYKLVDSLLHRANAETYLQY